MPRVNLLWELYHRILQPRKRDVAKNTLQGTRGRRGRRQARGPGCVCRVFAYEMGADRHTDFQKRSKARR